MKKIYRTHEGEWGDFSWLTYEFIKSTNQVKEFELFKSALIEEELDYFS